jgi:hypothetical protein
MKTTRILRSRAALLSAAFLLALTAASRADLYYSVNLNVASLGSNINGPFSLDLQLVTGSGQVSNSVTLSNFVVTGGSFTGTQTVVSGSGASGSIGSTLTLTDTSLDNEVYQAFGSGVTNISFNVDETNRPELPFGSGAPELFNVAILDGSLNNIPTTDPNTNDINAGTWTLLSGSSAIQGVNQLGVYNSSSSGEAPGVTTAAAAVPEPASAGLLLLGVAGLAARRRTVRRA